MCCSVISLDTFVISTAGKIMQLELESTTATSKGGSRIKYTMSKCRRQAGAELCQAQHQLSRVLLKEIDK